MFKLDWKDIGVTTQMHRYLEKVKLTPSQRNEVTQAMEVLRDDEVKKTKVGDLARARRLLGELKVPATLALVARLRESGTLNPVVWAWHNDLTSTLGEALGAFVVSQDVAVGKRDLILEEWRKDGKRPLVISLGIGQAGIDLSATSTAIITEPDWTPAVLSQAEMRTFVPGGPDISTYYLLTDHPADMAVTQRLLKKVVAASAIGVPAADVDFEAFLDTAPDPKDAVNAWLDSVMEDNNDFIW
jgi:hypothetical protein